MDEEITKLLILMQLIPTFTLTVSRNKVRNNDPSKGLSLFTSNEAASTQIAWQTGNPSFMQEETAANAKLGAKENLAWSRDRHYRSWRDTNPSITLGSSILE